MKKIFLLFAVVSYFCFQSIISNAQTPSWLWAKSAKGYSDNKANSVAVDDSGNVFIVGNCGAPFILGSDTLTNPSIFIAKYDANGNVLWLKGEGGLNYYVADATSVTVDTSGNTYMAGYFNSPTFILGSDTLINANNVRSVFLAKYDVSGNVLWAKCTSANIGTYGNVGDDEASSVAVDASGNILVAGWFESSTITFDSITLMNTGTLGTNKDLFLAKYNASGNVLWAKCNGGNGNDMATSVTADMSGNAYVTGYFYSSVITFDSINLTSVNSGSTDIFLAKYDADGNVLWAKSAGGGDYDKSNSVKVDSAGNTYLAGHFSNTITFSFVTLPYEGAFLVKYDAAGNVLWAKSAEGTGWEDEAVSIALDASGKIYIAGYFNSMTLDFGSVILTNANFDASYGDIFLAKYDSSSNVLWAIKVGSNENDRASSVAVDVSGYTYLAGFFNSLYLNFNTTVYNMVGGGDYDLFLAKLDSDTIITNINELSDSLNILVFPNPSIDKIIIIVPQKATIEILNIEGQIIKTIIHDSGETSIDIRDLSRGVYIVRVKTDKEIATKKIIKE